MIIRESQADDHAALFALYPKAFPEEDLLSLVADLLAAPTALSLIAEQDGAVVAHIGFTDCKAPGSDAMLSLLGPLAVTPALQRQGFGTALIQAGFDRLRERGIAKVLVLGDPKYYGRTGFTEEAAIQPPQPMPESWAPAWQSLTLGSGADKAAGPLSIAAFWDKPDYWR